MNTNQIPLDKIDSLIALYSTGKAQSALDEIRPLLKDFPNDKYGSSNKKRSNCSNCDTIRNKDYYYSHKQ